MGVYELSGAGSVKTGRTLYTSMNANNQYGAIVPIASSTATVDGESFVFSNIPQIYQDLTVVIFGRGITSGQSVLNDAWRINADSGSVYSSTWLLGDGATATSARYSSSFLDTGPISGPNATAGIFGSQTIQILNYTNSSTFKTVLSRSAADLNGSGQTALVVALYRSTNPVTRLDVFGNSGFKANSTATLYGIRAVSS